MLSKRTWSAVQLTLTSTRTRTRTRTLAQVLTATPTVHAHTIFLGDVGGSAERLRAVLPEGSSSICLDPAELPAAFKQAFAASVLRDA